MIPQVFKMNRINIAFFFPIVFLVVPQVETFVLLQIGSDNNNDTDLVTKPYVRSSVYEYIPCLVNLSPLHDFQTAKSTSDNADIIFPTDSVTNYDSRKLPLNSKDDEMMTESELKSSATVSETSNELIFPDDLKLRTDFESSTMNSRQKELQENITSKMTSENQSLSMDADSSELLILPDDPSLLTVTSSDKNMIKHSDVSENAFNTNSEYLTSSPLVISNPLTLPDDFFLDKPTSDNNVVLERLDLSNSGKTTNSEEPTVFEDITIPIPPESIFERIDTSENEITLQLTTEIVLEEKNIFDVPELKCEDGMKRDRRGKCRPVLQGPRK